MNLFQQEIEAYLSGAVRVERSKAGTVLHRLTRAQAARVADDGAFLRRMRTPAGITIGFRTDSPRVRLRALLLSNHSRWGATGIDYQVDGRLFHVRYEASSSSTVAVDLDLLPENASSSLRDIRVYPPCMRETVFLGLDLAEGASVVPLPGPPKKYLALGDSITQGVCAYRPSAAFPVRLAQRLGMELFNQGLGGHRFDPDFLDPEVCRAPDLITVAYGINDWTMGADALRIRKRVDMFLYRLLSAFPGAGGKVVLISPTRRADLKREAGLGEFQTFCRTIRETARERGVHAVDGMALIPDTTSLYDDGIHPTEEGFSHYARNLEKALQEIGLA